MKCNLLKRISCITAAVIFLLQPLGMCADAEGESAATRYVSIRSAADFLEFADNCRLDTWSKDAVVSLEYDISLKGIEFEPVPIFCGSFNGNGHTIRDLKIKGKVGEAGLFGIISEGARVYDLNVSGSVDPRGEIRAAGGICAVNSGTIENCSFSGTVECDEACGGICGINSDGGVISGCEVSGRINGLKITGGIAGSNLGMIRGCSNNAPVNSNVTDKKSGISDLKFESASDALKLLSFKKLHAAENIGGICGTNSGTVYGCANRGEIGKRNNGYNIGGICGSTSGLISQCTNSASVFGNENVGGISGIVEPYVATGYTEDLLTGPRKSVKELSDLVNTLLLDIDSCVNGISDCISETVNALSSAMTNLKYLEIELSSVINTKVSEINQITTLVRELQEDVGDISEMLEYVRTDISDVLEIYAKASEKWDEYNKNPTEENKEAAETLMEQASAGIGKILEKSGTNLYAIIQGIMITVKDNPLPQFAGIPESFNYQFGMLTDSLSWTMGGVKSLNVQLKATENLLNADIRALTNKISEMADSTFAFVYEFDFSLSTFLADASELGNESEMFNQGMLLQCTNEGAVEGTKAVGGVTGAMALNGVPEIVQQEVEHTGVSLKNLSYRAQLRVCKNYGQIKAEGDYAASICGKESIGDIIACEAYGTVEAGGDYVGGIAGLAHSTVRNCYSKCTLSGNNYVGGVVGSGAEKELLSGESSVSGCYANVTLKDYDQYCGAVSGSYLGSFSSNYFIGNDQNGINRYSIGGEAEPVSYSAVKADENTPSDFSDMKVRFKNGSATVSEVSFNYGDSLSTDIIPEVPQKFGMKGSWNRTSFYDLKNDVTVELRYSPSPVFIIIYIVLAAAIGVFIYFRFRRMSRGRNYKGAGKYRGTHSGR